MIAFAGEKATQDIKDIAHRVMGMLKHLRSDAKIISLAASKGQASPQLKSAHTLKKKVVAKAKKALKKAVAKVVKAKVVAKKAKGKKAVAKAKKAVKKAVAKVVKAKVVAKKAKGKKVVAKINKAAKKAVKKAKAKKATGHAKIAAH